MLKLPGLIDIHTHMRVPGGGQKEDFDTGTAAALAGGFTTILAMPNTSPPICTPAVLQQARQLVQDTARCAVGLYAGANGQEIQRLPALAPQTIALKIYINETFGPLRISDLITLMQCCATWPKNKPMALHAEGQAVAAGIGLAATYGRSIHFCHVSRREEIELIAAAKQKGLPVTCEVTPHHLYLTEADADRLGPTGQMRPPLATPDDVAALWQHLNTTVDCIATDHAPHTLAEKQSVEPPPGVPGLETALPLMLTAVAEKRLTMDRLVELMLTSPRRIFKLPEQADTYIEIDPDQRYMLSDENLYTKCGWMPFTGMTVQGQLRRVVLHGQTVFEKGKLLNRLGSGQIL